MAVIETSLHDGMYDVLLNRPDVENAVNSEMLDALDAVLDEVEHNDEVHGMLLRGAGASFCAGLDPREAGTRAFYPAPKERAYLSQIFSEQWSRWRVWRRFAELPKPVVAAVQGRALGEGALLAMAADWTVAAEDAVFGDPAIRMGMASANPLWLWTVGPRRAREILFGRFIDARTALRWGMIMRVTPAAGVEQEARTALEGLTSRSGMTGFDGKLAHTYLNRGASEAAGFATAHEFAQGIASMSAAQRGGFREGEYNFWARVDEIGIEAALRERDDRYAATAPTSA